MNLNTPIAEGTFQLMTTLVEEGQTTLSLEGHLSVYGKAWATYTLLSGSEARVAGTLVGNGRTLDDEGVMLATEITGVWSREKEIIHVTTLDQVGNGDQSLTRYEINILTKETSVKVFSVD